MNARDIHHGERVRNMLERSAYKQGTLAEALHMTPKTLARKLRQADWMTDDLVRVGKLLGFNPFDVYLPAESKLISGLLLNPVCLVNEEARANALHELKSMLFPEE